MSMASTGLSKMPTFTSGTLLKELKHQGWLVERRGDKAEVVSPRGEKYFFPIQTVDKNTGHGYANLVRHLMGMGFLSPDDWKVKQRSRIEPNGRRADPGPIGAVSITERQPDLPTEDADEAPPEADLLYVCNFEDPVTHRVCGWTPENSPDHLKAAHLGVHKARAHGIRGTSARSQQTRQAARPEPRMTSAGKPSAGPVTVRHVEPQATWGRAKRLADEMASISAEIASLAGRYQNKSGEFVRVLQVLEDENAHLKGKYDKLVRRLGGVVDSL